MRNIHESRWGSFKNTDAWAPPEADLGSPGDRMQLPMDSSAQPGSGNTRWWETSGSASECLGFTPAGLPALLELL